MTRIIGCWARRATDRRRRGHRHGDRGSVAVELAIILPLFVAMIAVGIVLGRVNLAYNTVAQAASDAARTASIARDADTARRHGEQVARTTLANQGLACQRVTVDIDASQFAVPVGQPAVVHATVTCQVAYTDVALPGVTPSREVTVSFTSPLDTWRARTLGFDNSDASSTTNRSGGRP